MKLVDEQSPLAKSVHLSVMNTEQEQIVRSGQSYGFRYPENQQGI
jgi:hypothetical protein